MIGLKNDLFIFLFLVLYSCISFGEGSAIINTDSMSTDSVKIVLFPLKKAVISSIVDTSVKKYNFKV